ncbi:WYL domain-containing protein [Streptomyces albidoflavus]|uniref:helix-turn-helix transcriptional regulator n=1 Tax=Streptomyces albidoflavus TaxID=1886 RepID=UPI0033D9F7F2
MSGVSTSSRLLKVVSLLSSRPSWTAGELADRMTVTERTVRRDISRLRELGYGVESDPGRWGGYRLGEGGRQLPLVLDDEESLAVAVALREAAQTGVLGDDQAALSALLKLRRMLPRRVAARLGALDGMFEYTSRSCGPLVASGLLAEIANVCRASERVRLIYRDGAGEETEREVDPHRLVFTGLRWFLVARDAVHGAWEAFRADQVVQMHRTGRQVFLDDPPDAAQFVARTLADGSPLRATVRLALPLEDVVRDLPIAIRRPDGPDATIVEIPGADAESLADYLLRLAVPLRVFSPDSVRDAVHRRATALAEQNAGPL